MSFWGYLRGGNAPNGHLVEVVESRVRHVLLPFISQIEVDEDFYLRQNPDVHEKVASGEMVSARHHYAVAGYFEDRFPRAIPVDEPWYLAEYPDVSQAVSRGTFGSARHHFEQEGFREGRLPSQDWVLVKRSAL